MIGAFSYAYEFEFVPPKGYSVDCLCNGHLTFLLRPAMPDSR